MASREQRRSTIPNWVLVVGLIAAIANGVRHAVVGPVFFVVFDAAVAIFVGYWLLNHGSARNGERE